MPAKFFPGIRSQMGRWTYYSVQLSMKDTSEILFAHQMEQFGGALSEAIQREINESRVKSQIVQYLLRQPDRFFNSIVIAGFGGVANWYPVSLEEDPRVSLIADEEMMGAFGILKMSADTKYYALDGQHRLLAIKSIMNPTGEFFNDRPKGFEDEKLSVVLVVPEEVDVASMVEYRKRFRRLFGHLNRYAKPMDQATSIIMDEDDSFAISLRRLFAEHEFFKVVGRDRDSTRVDTGKGRNISEGQTHLTKLEVLYDMCEILLSSATRENHWRLSGLDADSFKRFRPDDDVLEEMYLELSAIWSAIVTTIPEIAESGVEMRNNHVTDIEDPQVKNHLLFRPLAQKPFARVVRHLLDVASLEWDDKLLTAKRAESAIKPLAKVPWDLGLAPWRNIVWQNRLSRSGEPTWTMPNENRKKIENYIESLLMTSLSGDDESRLDDLKNEYLGLVVRPANDPDFSEDFFWNEVKKSLSF
jgi:DNA sulfur modification protein DndB